MSGLLNLVNSREMTPEEVREWLKTRRLAALVPRAETPEQRRERLADERAERLRENLARGLNGTAEAK